MNDLFFYNKYTRWYFSIIEAARCQPREKGDGTYYEVHHVIPKSLSGSNDASNLVLLTYKEHLIAHRLLTKMCVKGSHKRSMHYALKRMLYGNSKQSTRDRKDLPIDFSGEMNAFYGKKHSEATKEKLRAPKSEKHRAAISASLKERYLTQDNPFKGKKHSEESREKMSSTHRVRQTSVGEKNPMFGKSVHSVWRDKYGLEEANRLLEEQSSKRRGKSIHSEEWKAELSRKMTGRKHSPESIEKMRAAALRRYAASSMVPA